MFSKHLFSALVQQQNVNTYTPRINEITEINFKQFLMTLSTVMRGTVEERVRWMFQFYDLNKDGIITKEVSWVKDNQLKIEIMNVLIIFRK